MSDRANLEPLFATLAERHPDGIAVVERSADRTLAVVWASRAIAWLGGAPLAERLDATALARWQAACEDALAGDRAVELALPFPRGPRRITIVPLDATRVAIQPRPEHDDAGEHPARSQLLFSQNVHAVFFMRLDEPFHWTANPAEQDALLDYAFEHLRVTAANDVMCRQMERPRELLVGAPPSARWVGAAHDWREHMRLLYNQGHTYHSVLAPRGDGSWFDVEGEYVCTYDAEGRITGHCGIQRDITQARLAVTELASSRERLELAIAGANIGIWETDVPNRLTYTDPRWMARMGYGESGAWRAWDWWLSVIHSEDRDGVKRAFTDHVTGATPLFRAEYRVRTGRGDWVWLLSTGQQARDQPHRVAGIFVDITERKQLQARVVASERLAALGTLAAGVGHEINNPLTYVVLTLALMDRELAAGPPTTAAFTALIERARYGTERVGAIVRDLQMLARPHAERVTAIDPIAIVERCLQIADHQIRPRARVVCELAPTPPVRCSEDRLVQVFLNLLVNAAQAIPEGDADAHWIRVTTATTPDGRVAVEVSDNGAGIEPHDLDRIFEPFFTTKGVGDGTGLGLSICRSIVSGLGGEIEVDSERGRGSRFRVLLPADA